MPDSRAHEALHAMARLNHLMAQDVAGDLDQRPAIEQALQAIAAACAGDTEIQRTCQTVRDQAVEVMTEPDDMRRRTNLHEALETLAVGLRQRRDGGTETSDRRA